MRVGRLLVIAAMLACSVGLIHCGNGVKTSPGSGGTGTGTGTTPGGVTPTGGTGNGSGNNPEIVATSFLPQVDFALPFPDTSAQAASGANLTGPGSDPAVDPALVDAGTGTVVGNDVLATWTTRLDGQIRRANSIFATLDKAGVNHPGSFVKRGPDTSLAATVTALTNDSTYAYDAIVCRLGKPLTHVRWSSDGLKIAFERFDSAGAGVETKPTDMNLAVVYGKSASGAAVDFNADGQAAGTPWEPESGTYGKGARVTEAMHGERAADGTVILRGVNAWHDDSAMPAVADGYLTGTTAPSQAGAPVAGSFVAYRRLDTADCPNAFNEAQPSAPGWCLGRDLGQDARYNDAGRAAAWTALMPIGIESVSSLRVVPGPTASIICPSADSSS